MRKVAIPEVTKAERLLTFGKGVVIATTLESAYVRQLTIVA